MHQLAIPSALRRVTPQPLLGGSVFLVGIAAVAAGFVLQPPHSAWQGHLYVFLFLVAAVSATRFIPVHIGRKTRIYVASAPLYLLCCLFPAPVAAAGVGVGMMLRELGACLECENSPGTMGSQVGRWMLLSLGVSSLVNLWPSSQVAYPGAIAVVLLWVGDVLSCPLVFTPITGIGPFALIRTVARQSYAGELMQYLVALVGLVLFRTGILWTGMLWVDVLSIQLVLLPFLILLLYLRSEDSRHGVPLPADSRMID